MFQTGRSSSDGDQDSQGLCVRLHMPCEERMQIWGLFSLGEEAALGGDEEPGGPPVHVRRSPRRQTHCLHSGAWQKDNRQILRKEGFRLHIKENIFTIAQTGCDISTPRTFSRVDWLKPWATWCDPT